MSNSTPPPTSHVSHAFTLLLAVLLATGCGDEAHEQEQSIRSSPRSALDQAPSLAERLAAGAAPIRFGISASVTRDFDEAGFADPAGDATRLCGALEFLVGTPQQPTYAALDGWLEEGRDPSFGQDELEPSVWERIEAENRERFRVQLGFLKAGGYEAMPEPGDATDLWASWRSIFAPLIAGEVQGGDVHPQSPSMEESTKDDPAFTWADEAERFWAERYPSLGQSAALFGEHCQSCHGATGAGDGPAGVVISPRPRDFSLGLFKWTRAAAGQRARRSDLSRVLEHGVPGTLMTAFAQLTLAEREGLVDWVRWLAVRGETERIAVQLAAEEGALLAEHFLKAYALVWSRWDAAAQIALSEPALPVAPRSLGDAARAERGALLFRGELSACSTCHGDDGRGDGPAVWEEGPDGPRRRSDVWGDPSHPRDLALDILRGGDQAADIYHVVRHGIAGTIMPAAAESLTEEGAWDLVAFVLSLRSRAGTERE